MIENINTALHKAYMERETNDYLTHPEKVKRAAVQYMRETGRDTTPEIKVNGHRVKFQGEKELQMIVDGESFSGQEMDKKINKIDLVGPEYKTDRKKAKLKNSAKAEAKNVARVARVDITRKITNYPVKVANEGSHAAGSLLRGLWALLQRGMYR